ncbi:MAG: permease [Phycisphaerae bacterium]|nr:permease [Phycisphaerae bacterium]
MRSWLLSNPGGRARRYGPFLVWATWFIFAWATLIVLGDFADEALDHWETSLAMLFGSYVAGSTPMGGGTVGFPVLVLILGTTAELGRQFSFAIQAVGMTSAAIFIVCSGRPIAIRLMLWAMAVSAVTLPVVATWVVPLLPESVVKLAFACIWGSFGILTIVKLGELRHMHRLTRLPARVDAVAGVAIGIVGGTASALTGVGIDMIAYTVLVLLYRCDLRVAISTSVLLMAWNSLVGLLTEATLGRLSSEVLYHWLAAAPVVLAGAPLGALALQIIPRLPTMIFVAALCLVQLVWMCVHVGVGWAAVGGVVAAMLVANGVFHLLYVSGKRIAATAGQGDSSSVVSSSV